MDNFLVGQLNNGCGGSIDTTTIINEGPEFAAYMTVDDQGNPQGTNVIFFKNGGLILDSQNNVYIESFPNQQMFRLDNPFQKPQVTLSGKLPALPLGFITYPADATYSAAPEITLHRYASHSTIDTLKTYVVKRMARNPTIDIKTMDIIIKLNVMSTIMFQLHKIRLLQ